MSTRKNKGILCVCVLLCFFFNIATGVIYIVTGILCIKNILLITAGISKKRTQLCVLPFASFYCYPCTFLLLFIPFICFTNNIYAWINLCFKVVIAPSFVSLSSPHHHCVSYSSFFLMLLAYSDWNAIWFRQEHNNIESIQI